MAFLASGRANALITIDPATCVPQSSTTEGCALNTGCGNGRYLFFQGDECSYENCDGNLAAPLLGNDGSAVGISCGGSPTPGDSYTTIRMLCCLPTGGTLQSPATNSATLSETSTSTSTSYSTSSTHAPPPPLAPPPEPPQAFTQSMELLGTAAQQEIAFGAIDCLEGLSKFKSEPETAQAKTGRCISEVDSAKQLHEKAVVAAERAGKELAGLELDPALMSSNRAGTALNQFEKNFGGSGEDFVNGLLRGTSGRTALEEALHKRWSAAQTQSFLDAAEEKKGKQEYDVSIQARQVDPVALKSSLREKLKNSISRQSAGGSEKRRPSSERKIDSVDQELQALTPLSDPFGKLEPGLTLFEVVRAKFQEKWKMLIPYRASKSLK